MSTTLTTHEKQAIVSLRDNGVSSATVARAFGITTGSVAAYMANANRKLGNSVPAKKK